ncbi:susD family protein [Prevotella sp. CAG:1124]|nr:susD family protein [Prevotella sp. CAG:1124]
MLNDIITNRTTDATKTVTAGDITLDRIYVERRKELVGEGQRYFDVLRRGETVTRYTDVNNRGWHDALSEEARTFSRDSEKALPLIPQSELDVNPNMQQNPEY